ncbi:MAG: bifunctional hydroxymethylpyrimidine kinase/phosphomethylpyrimidine kinase [Pseudomonadota bacterium]
MTAIALTIAGSDSGGGAGIQADLKAFSALGVYGASVLTAVTAQNTKAVTAVHEIPVEIIHAQIEAVLDDLDVDAIKIGMLSSPEIIAAVAGALSDVRVPIVLDPVMVAKSGDRLLQERAVAALQSLLLPMATLVTPNAPEAAILTDTEEARGPETLKQQGEALIAAGAKSALMKGGHLEGDICTDIFVTDGFPAKVLRAARVQTRNTHGTGCTLSAAIAAHLSRGRAVSEAVAEAHAYLNRAIVEAGTLQIGSGHGPVHHFHGAPAWRR